MEVIELFETLPTFFLATVFLFSLATGSFLNVVIYRVPVMMQRDWHTQCRELLAIETPDDSDSAEVFNLIKPDSRCPHCGHKIGALENIPVISYLIQRGRCRHCNGPISARYPSIELLTAILGTLVAWQFGVSWETLFGLFLTYALVALTFIDVDHQLLPDSITLPFLWLGLLLNLSGVFVDIHASLIGAVAGYLTLWSVYHLFKLVTGKEGMGFGDFKLLAMLGAWLGWQMLPVVVILSSLVGAIVGIGMIVLRGHDRQVPIPFGPYLAAAGWLAMMWGTEITQAYLAWITPA